jgi:hypothetical protein
MGSYGGMKKEVSEAVRELRAREEGWLIQEKKTIESLQWCAILEDEAMLDRLCNVIEKNHGMESPEVKRALTGLFQDAAAPDFLRARAGECLNRTDWRRATDGTIFSWPEEIHETIATTAEKMADDIRTRNKRMRSATLVAMAGLGNLPGFAPLVRKAFNDVAADEKIPADVRAQVRNTAEILDVLQRKTAKSLIAALETEEYRPRPRLRSI